MTAVQRPLWSIHRHIDILVAARAEDNFLAARLMHWSIADDPRVRLQQVLMQIDDLAEMRRAGFLFAFEQKLYIKCWRQTVRLQSIKRSENSHDTRFVVRSSARVDAP